MDASAVTKRKPAPPRVPPRSRHPAPVAPALLAAAFALTAASRALAQGGDSCSTALTITGNGPFAWDNRQPVRSALNGANMCASASRDVFFRWQSPGNGAVTVSTCGQATIDTVLAVYADACPFGPALSCNDDGCNLFARTTFTAAAGSWYLIRLAQFGTAGPGSTGTFSIDAPQVPPPNDLCANAAAIAGVGTFPFDNQHASFTPGPPACTPLSRDVWYNWTCTGFGDFAFDTCSTQPVIDSVLVAYNGTCAVPGLPEQCSDDHCGGLSRITLFGLTPGEQRLIRIASDFGGAGSPFGVLTVTALTPTSPTAVATAQPTTIDNGGSSGTVVTVQVQPGTNPTSTGVTVTVDASSIGAGVLNALDDGQPPDQAPSDGRFTTLAVCSPFINPADHQLFVQAFDAQGRSAFTSVIVTVTDVPQGACTSDYNATGSTDGDDLADFIADFFDSTGTLFGFPAPAPIPGGYGGNATLPFTGFGRPCPLAQDVPQPNPWGAPTDAYRTNGFKVGLGQNNTPCTTPNGDDLADYISVFFNGCP